MMSEGVGTRRWYAEQIRALVPWVIGVELVERYTGTGDRILGEVFIRLQLAGWTWIALGLLHLVALRRARRFVRRYGMAGLCHHVRLGARRWAR